MTFPQGKDDRSDRDSCTSPPFDSLREKRNPDKNQSELSDEIPFGWRTELPFKSWLDFYNAGVFFLNSGETENAISSFGKAIEIAPNEPTPLLTLARLLYENGKIDHSAQLFEKLTMLTPDDPSVWLTLGFIRFQQGKYRAAVPPLYRTTQVEPSNMEANYYLAESLRKIGRFSESLPYYQNLLPYGTRFPQAVYGYGKALLSDARLADGWEAMEFRKVCTFGTWEMHNLPDWNGSPEPEKTVVAYAEGSIAEQIMYASVLPDLIENVKHCVIECDESLHSLFLRSFPKASVVGLPKEPVNLGTLFVGLNPKNETGKEIIGTALDEQIAFGSLPRYYRKSVLDFPKKSSYLEPDKELLEKWSKKLEEFGNVLKIGILWKGSWSEEHPSQLEIPLEVMKDLLVPRPSKYRVELPKLKGIPPEERVHPVFLRTDSVQWISLQHGSAGKDYKVITDAWKVRNISQFPEILQRNLDSMAALVASLDLVITPPGFTAHLAGALGVPTWVLLPNLCDWRWRLGGTKSDWHPSVRLFRQGAEESFQNVITKTENALEFYLSKYFARPSFYDENILEELQVDPTEILK